MKILPFFLGVFLALPAFAQTPVPTPLPPDANPFARSHRPVNTDALRQLGMAIARGMAQNQTVEGLTATPPANPTRTRIYTVRLVFSQAGDKAGESTIVAEKELNFREASFVMLGSDFRDLKECNGNLSCGVNKGWAFRGIVAPGADNPDTIQVIATGTSVTDGHRDGEWAAFDAPIPVGEKAVVIGAGMVHGKAMAVSARLVAIH
jgi:hypothetical protein